MVNIYAAVQVLLAGGLGCRRLSAQLTLRPGRGGECSAAVLDAAGRAGCGRHAPWVSVLSWSSRSWLEPIWQMSELRLKRLRATLGSHSASMPRFKVSTAPAPRNFLYF